MGKMLFDARYGLRMLLKSPGVTVAAVVALALGVGANTAIFSVVNSVLLRSLPFEESDRLVVIWETNPLLTSPSLRLRNEASPANFYDWKAGQTSFEEMGAYNWNTYNLTGGDMPEQIVGNPVTGGLFATLRAKPLHGRVITAEDDREGAERVVVISHKLWQRRFGADPSVVGRQITLSDQPTTVIGVMGPDFEFPNGYPELWTPMQLTAQRAQSRGAHYLYTRARLKPGVTLEQAQAELQTVARRLEQQYPETNTQRSVRLVTLQDETVQQMRPMLLTMLGAVGFVLLIACANVANLMLARAAGRRKEIAIRTALGAGRWRIVRQLLTESVILALAGGALGLLLALWGIDLLKAAVPEQMTTFIYGWNRIGLDARVLLFTLAVSVFTGLLFGLAPAIQSSKTGVNESLKEGERGSTGGRQRLRSALVVSEVALSLILLVGAGLMMRSFMRLTEVRPGFDPSNLLTVSMSLPRARYDNNQKIGDFYARLSERVSRVPGVEGAAAVSLLPMGGSGSTTSFVIDGRPAPQPGEEPEANYRSATPTYFETMRIPVLRGRVFEERDATGRPVVAVVNETFVRTFFPDEDPIGRIIYDPQRRNPPAEIVGVVGDVKHWGLDDEPEPYLYAPHAQSGENFMTLVVRAGGDPESLTAAVRREVLAIDRDQPVFDVKTMESRIEQQSAQKRVLTWLLAVTASVALILAAIGIYGVVAYTVAQRTHEIGIRMALGARAGDILRLVLGQGMILVSAGIVLGLAGALGLMVFLTKSMSNFLFSVSGTDPAVYAGVAALLGAVALLACLVPARRASRVDPMEALRYE
jgi:putative ABC transport system permease protein